MKTLLTHLLLAVTFFISTANLSQARPKGNIVKLENKAFKAYLSKDYERALQYLLQLDTLTAAESHRYDYWIGLCLLSTENKLGAIPYLENALRSGSTSFVVNYYLGRAYLYAGRLEEAKHYLNSYIQQYASNNIKFEAKEKIVSEGHRIHVEKSLQDVTNLIAECDAKLILQSARNSVK